MDNKELFYLIDLNGRCTDALEEYVYQSTKEDVGLHEVKNQIEEASDIIDRIKRVMYDD